MQESPREDRVHVSLFDADAVPPPSKSILAAGIAVVAAVVFLLDHLTAPYFSFTPLYLLPIAAATWIWGGRVAVVAAAVSALAHFVGHLLVRKSANDWIWLAGDSVVLLAMFLIFAWFVSWLHQSAAKALREARVDALTGVAQRGIFLERGRWELARAARYSRPLTVAYLDIDRFKAVNDRHGHEAGDRVLASVGGVLQKGVRTFDLVGRLGGDEFALLLPETNAVEAGVLLQRLRGKLAAVVSPHGSQVNFSIGAVTISDASDVSLETLVARADALMYAVKRASGNGLRQETLAAAGPTKASGTTRLKRA